jgi:hypothetical protein
MVVTRSQPKPHQVTVATLHVRLNQLERRKGCLIVTRLEEAVGALAFDAHTPTPWSDHVPLRRLGQLRLGRACRLGGGELGVDSRVDRSGPGRVS